MDLFNFVHREPLLVKFYGGYYTIIIA